MLIFVLKDEDQEPIAKRKQSPVVKTYDLRNKSLSPIKLYSEDSMSSISSIEIVDEQQTNKTPNDCNIKLLANICCRETTNSNTKESTSDVLPIIHSLSDNLQNRQKQQQQQIDNLFNYEDLNSNQILELDLLNEIILNTPPDSESNHDDSLMKEQNKQITKLYNDLYSVFNSNC